MKLQLASCLVLLVTPNYDRSGILRRKRLYVPFFSSMVLSSISSVAGCRVMSVMLALSVLPPT